MHMQILWITEISFKMLHLGYRAGNFDLRISYPHKLCKDNVPGPHFVLLGKFRSTYTWYHC